MVDVPRPRVPRLPGLPKLPSPTEPLRVLLDGIGDVEKKGQEAMIASDEVLASVREGVAQVQSAVGKKLKAPIFPKRDG